MTGQDLVLPASVEARLARAADLYDARAALLALPDPDDRRTPRAAQYHRQARSEQTRRAYLRWIEVYLDWCDKARRRDMPATTATIEAFTVYLAERPVGQGKNRGRRGYAPNTIRQALSAIRTYHRLQGENPPDLLLAAGVVEGHARIRAQDPTNTDGQGPPGMRLPTLMQLFEVLPEDTNAGLRDRALLALGWAMMARRSELAALNVDDLVEVPAGLEVRVRRSKTDQLGRGRTVAIPHKPDLGPVDPVACVLAWKRRLGDLGLVDGPFLRGVDRHGNVNGTDQWAGSASTSDSGRMAPQTIEAVIMRAAKKAGVRDADKYRGHSLRRGGATDAYAAGADILSIARHGRWGERSPVVFRYIEDAHLWSRNPLADIAAPGG